MTMILPDILNTMLMGLIFMVILVTVIRPLVLNVIGNPVYTDAEQQALLDTMYSELERMAYEEEAKRAQQIRYQQLLIELPPRLQPKPVPEPEPEPEVSEAQDAEQATADAGAGADAASPDEAVAPEADGQPVVADAESADAAEGVSAEGEPGDEAVAEGEIEIREGETLAEIKERMKKEQKNAKKPSIPPELLNNAKSYEDKVGVVRMVVHQDQSRVAAVIRGMIETK
jgi:hypothetical protein